jgi:hypothetical protein
MQILTHRGRKKGDILPRPLFLSLWMKRRRAEACGGEKGKALE